MSKWLCYSRSLFVLLAFLLAFSPIAVFANAKDSNTLTYVALGDSLAAGMLADRTIGEGYVGKITNKLTERGYQVNSTNLGINGATSSAINNNLDASKFANADLITITAGVNDLLFPELKEIENLDPLFFNKDAVHTLILDTIAPIKEDLLHLSTTVGTLSINVQNTLDSTEKANNDLLDNQEALLQVMTEEDLNAIMNTFTDIDQSFSVKEEINKMEVSLNEISELFTHAQTNGMDISKLTALLNKLQNDMNNLNDIAIDTENIKNSLGENYTFVKEYIDPVIDTINETKIVANQLKDNAIKLHSDFQTIIPVVNEINDQTELAALIGKKMGEAGSKIPEVANNLASILTKIYQVNPDADIYLMGYYNAFPSVPEAMQAYIIQLLDNLNLAIQNVANSTGTTYVSTKDSFIGNEEVYLPVPNEIHPSDAGYKAIAHNFLTSFGHKYPGVTTIPEMINIPLNVQKEVHPGQILLIDTPVSAIIELPVDLPKGTKISVQNKDIKDPNHLIRAGSILDIEFIYPEGHENFVSNDSYTLHMTYNHKVDDTKIDIYHLNNGSWVAKNGHLKTMLDEKVISISINQFSSYGVFAMKEQDDALCEGSKCEQDKDKDVHNEIGAPKVETINNDNNKDDGLIVEIDSEDESIHTEGKTQQSSVGTLPATATNYYNFIAIGLFIILMGLGVWIYQRRKEY